jgi:hypothetical protein
MTKSIATGREDQAGMREKILHIKMCFGDDKYCYKTALLPG